MFGRFFQISDEFRTIFRTSSELWKTFHTEVSGLSGASNSGTCSTGKLSRVIFFFMERGSILEGKVYDTKRQVPPISKVGLEIVLEVTFKISDEKKRYLERLIAFMNGN